MMAMSEFLIMNYKVEPYMFCVYTQNGTKDGPLVLPGPDALNVHGGRVSGRFNRQSYDDAIGQGASAVRNIFSRWVQSVLRGADAQIKKSSSLRSDPFLDVNCTFQCGSMPLLASRDATAKRPYSAEVFA